MSERHIRPEIRMVGVHADALAGTVLVDDAPHRQGPAEVRPQPVRPGTGPGPCLPAGDKRRRTGEWPGARRGPRGGCAVSGRSGRAGRTAQRRVRRWVAKARALADGGWRDLVPRQVPELWRDASTAGPDAWRPSARPQAGYRIAASAVRRYRRWRRIGNVAAIHADAVDMQGREFD